MQSKRNSTSNKVTVNALPSTIPITGEFSTGALQVSLNAILNPKGSEAYFEVKVYAY